MGAGEGEGDGQRVDNLVFLAVLFAAACHAGWNALIKVGLDPLSTTTLISLGSGAVALFFLPFVGLPALAAWPWIGASVIIHLFYFGGADRGLSHRRPRTGLSDRARLGAVDDRDGDHAFCWRDDEPARLGRYRCIWSPVSFFCRRAAGATLPGSTAAPSASR